MEETKEIQGLYKIFRVVVYVSLLLEFFEYAVDLQTIGHWNGVLVDIHDRIKTWFIYHDGNLIYAKVTTFLLICITCVGTRNKKHLEMDARKQVLYPLLGGVGLAILSVWIFGFSIMPHILSFLNRNYQTIFDVLQTDNEVVPLLGPFQTTKFFCMTDFDMAEIAKEEAGYVELPKFYTFPSKEEHERVLYKNFLRVGIKVKTMIAEIQRRAHAK